ncbi:MAG: hypothetical protein AB1418_05135 [Pseudomonadota bacterium]
MKRFAALLLLVPLLAWAGPGEDAEFAANRILLEEEMLNAQVVSNSKGRITLLFGRSVGPGLIDSVVRRMKRDPAIRGLTYVQVDNDFCTLR